MAMRRFCWSVVVLLMATVGASGATMLLPQDEGAIVFPIRSLPDSTTSLQQLNVVVTAPPWFVPQVNGHGLLAGESFDFIVGYHIDPANLGTEPSRDFTVTLGLSAPDGKVVLPPLEQVSRSIEFHIDNPPPSVDLVAEFPDTSYSYGFTGIDSEVVHTPAGKVVLVCDPDGGAPVTTVRIYKEGALVHEAEGGADVVEVEFPQGVEELEVGKTYTFEVFNSAGRLTSGEFDRYTHTVSVSTSASVATYNEQTGAFEVAPHFTSVNTGTSAQTVRIHETTLSGNRYVASGASAVLCSGDPGDCAEFSMPGNATLEPKTYQLVSEDANSEVTQAFSLEANAAQVSDPYLEPAQVDNLTIQTFEGGTETRLTLQPDQLFAPTGFVISRTYDLAADSAAVIGVPPGAIGTALLITGSEGLDRNFDVASFGSGGPGEAGHDGEFTGMSIKWELATGDTAGSLEPERLATLRRIFYGMNVDESGVHPYVPNDTPSPPVVLPLKRYARLKQTLTRSIIPHRSSPAGGASPLLLRLAFSPTILSVRVLQGEGALFKLASDDGILEFTAPVDNLFVKNETSPPEAPQGLVRSGAAYNVDPPVIIFNTPATVLMHFSSATVIAEGFDPQELQMYEADPGGEFHVLPNQIKNLDAGTVTAFLGQVKFSSVFALFGATHTYSNSPVAPGPTQVLSRSSSTLNLTWSSNGNLPGTTYDVYYGPQTGMACDPSGVSFATASVSIPGHQLFGLQSTVPYLIRVCNAAVSQGEPCNGYIQVETTSSGSESNPAFERCGAEGGLDALALSADGSGRLWQISGTEQRIVTGIYDVSGGPLSFTELSGASGVATWRTNFDSGGSAYASGAAFGQNDDLNAAVYRQNSLGTVIGTASWDSAVHLNDVSFDAAAAGNGIWLTGLTQTAGTTDEAPTAAQLALWRYDFSTQLLSLAGSYGGSGGLDVGLGVAAAADGGAWVVGLSSRTDTVGAAKLAMALWRFGAGGSLAAGPFLIPGIQQDIDALGAAVQVSTSNVLTFINKRGAQGDQNLLVAEFGLDGSLRAQREWSSASGGDDVPSAALRLPSQNVAIAGRVGSGQENILAYWTFSSTGAFIGAQTGATGGAKGLAINANGTWLAAGNGNGPVLYSGGAAIPGSVAETLTPAAPSLLLNPSTGPIGIPFSISGVGFGSYAGGDTRVKFGSVPAPLSVWNDTSIQGSIPGLATGTYAVTVERQNGTTVESVSAGSFTVTGLEPSGLSVSSAPIGAPFTITGSGFGPYAGGNTRVLLGGVAAPLSVWNDTTISGTVPGVAAGTTTILVERATADGGLSRSEEAPFEVLLPSVTALSPASGPIGAAFTLSGHAFGPYGGANTVVLIGGATAPLSVWNDTSIVGTVPGSLAPGARSVVVKRLTSDGGVASSNEFTFSVTGLALTALTPSTGPIGLPFTLTGAGFGAYAGGDTRVVFGTVTAALSVWTDTSITGTVPGLSTGPYAVRVERQQGADVSASDASSFTVTALLAGAPSPSSGPVGTAFTLTGPGFGPYAGANTRVLIGGMSAALSVWNDLTITGTVPGLTPGTHELRVERVSGAVTQTSESSSFTVVGPLIASLSPSSGPIGVPFTLSGSGFGAYAGGNTRVLVGGVAAALSTWNDTSIIGTIPALPAGAHALRVERQTGAFISASATYYFEVLVPDVQGLTPSSGPIGVPFTLSGSGFGSYAGGNTRVLVGGVAAPLSVWNDTTISGSIPALPPGVHAMRVERQSGSTVSSSATGYFEVLVPDVQSLTPSSAPIGAPFTITGAHFGPYAGGNTRVKFNGVAAPLSVWNDTTIVGSVPGSLAPGEVEVVVERAAGSGLSSSATGAFLVLVPVVSTVSPGFGPTGTVVTLTGSGFGPYAGGNTKVLVGGEAVPLSVWNDTTIRWTVPSSFADGEYPVVVLRTPAGGSVQSDTATFTVGTGYGGASFSFGASLSLAATPDTHFEGDMNLSKDDGGRIETPSKAAVQVPPNALPQDTEITLHRVRSDTHRAQGTAKAGLHAAGEAIEFGPEGTRFSAPVTIELPYDPAQTGDEASVAVHYYNPLTRAWEALPSVVDRARRVVKAQTTHFSLYQPLGLSPATASQDALGLREVYAYPNPVRGASRVTFRVQPGLADSVEVRVYDLAGRKLHASSDWVHTNPGGEHVYESVWDVSGVASGVYTFAVRVTGGGKTLTRTGKVGVIK